MKVHGINIGIAEELAEKIQIAFSNGGVSVKELGITHAQAQRIYRAMKKDKYAGNIALYVCKKIWECHFEEVEKYLDILREYALDAFEAKSEKIVKEKFENFSDHMKFCMELHMTIIRHRYRGLLV